MKQEDNDQYDLTELENDEVIRKLLNISMSSSDYYSMPEFRAKHFVVLSRLQKLYNEGELILWKRSTKKLRPC